MVPKTYQLHMFPSGKAFIGRECIFLQDAFLVYILLSLTKPTVSSWTNIIKVFYFVSDVNFKQAYQIVLFSDIVLTKYFCVILWIFQRLEG